ncbi:Cyclic AMP-responsive element-binding protein 1 [Hondaea fermentalgiana]|uniref:Cyclic AMP-responsive element-binding protein 1 n=1 Tax=Hondaea fermentalgiana TaxID=2315210 RepID=A0A2R5GCD8_9STRA|nr:Cyclic AMP-responsive element-binding protein 1 [Hondaea fermentalgiana]|eukprot:GBG27378.1 Cyclic AMP-responsive element-binding protein 1 [Hondaea fermentalgiana]
MDSESALNFVAGESAGMSGADSDLASWMLMSGDLLGSSGVHGLGDESFGMDPLMPGAMMPHPPQPGQPQEQGLQQAVPPTRGARRTRKAANPNAAFAAPHQHAAMMQQQQQQQQQQHAALGSPMGMPQPQQDAVLSPPPSVVANNNNNNNNNGVKRKLDRVSSVASSTTSGNTTSNNKPADPTQKRQRRLEKNREIARNCRRRKREKYQKLEEEVDRLRQWNKQLETQLNQGKDGSAKEAARKQEMTRMRKHVENAGNVDELKSMLKQYKELYSDFGRERNAAITYHLSKLKGLLIPTTVSKMTMWSLQQNDEFYDEKKNQKTFGGGIWNMLCGELELSAEQKATLMSMRGGIRQQRRNIAECLRILTELDSRVKSNFESMAKQMDQVMESISPSQQAKFLLWIERNQACTFMLNNMWNKATDDDPTAYPGTDEEFADSASTMGLSDDANSASTPRHDHVRKSHSSASRASSTSSTSHSPLDVKDESSK